MLEGELAELAEGDCGLASRTCNAKYWSASFSDILRDLLEHLSLCQLGIGKYLHKVFVECLLIKYRGRCLEG